MKRYSILSLVSVVVFLLAGTTAGYSQKIDSMINVYGEKFPQEKIYIQFDRPAYNTGETIWFKAYLYAGIGPSKVSKNFYAELVDLSGRVIQRKLLPIFESTAAGSFDLPDTLKSSTYIFRAYTTWMLNFDSSFLYSKTIRILNKITTPAGTSGAATAKTPAAKTPAASASATTAPVTTLKFFPEGGDLVSGLESIVAFKATDPYGFPVTVEGKIKDASGATITDLKTEHDGMGSFALEAKPGYIAEWTDEKKQTYKTPLPAARSTGVVIRALQNNNGMESFIIKRPTDASANLKTLYLVGYFNQQVIYKARLNMQETTMISGVIPLKGIPSGILQMTVFDADWSAQSERICFVNKEDYFFQTRVTPVLKDTDKRGKNSITIEVPDTIKTNLSIAITDAVASKADPDADNIVSRLLLTGDIRGYIHNPYYYFFGNDEVVRSHLDLVMMTNGWRRYKWDDMLAGKLPEIKYKPENYLSIAATLTGLLPSQVPRNTELNVFLEAKDSSRQLFMLTAGPSAKFQQDGLIFFDTVKVFYQFNNNKQLANQAVFNFSNGTWKSPRTIKPDTSWQQLIPLDTALLNRGKFFAAEAARIKPELERKVKVLDAVVVKAKVKSKEQELDEKYTSGLFKGGDAMTFDLINDPFATGGQTILQYLQGKVAGLQITGAGTGSTQLSWRGATPTIFLNEMQTDVSQVESISMSDVAYVKVFRPPFFGATGGGAGGAIAVYTKKGGDQKSEPGTGGMSREILVGYAPPKEFYSPDYSKSNQFDDVADVRNTLFWAPYILTEGSSRKVTIVFYNNDVSKRLRIVLEGMDEEGKLTRSERLIEQ
jgi:hypothetical protein